MHALEENDGDSCSCGLYSLIFSYFVVMSNCVNSVVSSLSHNKNRVYTFMPQALVSELRVVLSGTKTHLLCDRDISVSRSQLQLNLGPLCCPSIRSWNRMGGCMQQECPVNHTASLVHSWRLKICIFSMSFLEW